MGLYGNVSFLIKGMQIKAVIAQKMPITIYAYRQPIAKVSMRHNDAKAEPRNIAIVKIPVADPLLIEGKYSPSNLKHIGSINPEAIENANLGNIMPYMSTANPVHILTRLAVTRAHKSIHFGLVT